MKIKGELKDGNRSPSDDDGVVGYMIFQHSACYNHVQKGESGKDGQAALGL